MKKILFGVAALGLLGLAGAGVGLRAQDTVEAKADGVSGTITIDTTEYWCAEHDDGEGCHVAVYFYAGVKGTETPSGVGWSSYVYVAKNQGLTSVDYALDFTPNYMIAVRYSNWLNETGDDSWQSNPWRSGVWGKWNQTQDLDFYNNAHINVNGWNSGEVNSVSYVVPGEEDWTKQTDLAGIKLNGSNHCEYYSDSVSIAKDEEFKIYYRNTGYGDDHCDLSSFVSDCFTINSDNESDDKIVCTKAGTYSIYFDATGHIFITDPVAAAADEWAQAFLGVTASTDTCAYTKEHWTTSAGSYATLDDDVKDLFVAEDHVDHEANTTSYLQKAVQRYDYALELYGTGSYSDFMGRVEAKKVTPKSAFAVIAENNPESNAPVYVVAATLVTVAAAGAIIIARKRRAE